MMNIRNRIKELRRVRASDLRPNPKNWRKHPQTQQDALRGVLAEVGYADAVIARELTDGTLELVDGHLRAETTPDMEVPVLVTDLDESEAELVLATLDPLAAMAETDVGKLDALLRDVQTGSQELAAMLEQLAEDNGIVPADEQETELKQLDVRPPPKMSWVLLGIPTVRFGEIAADIERLATVATICETTVNDG